MTKRTWLGIGLVAMSFAASSPVLARGEFSADADFVSDSSDCVESEVHVFVRGGANDRGKIDASVVEVDYCKGQTLLDAQAKHDLAKGALRLKGSNVILDTTVQMLDAVTHNAISVKIAVEWVGSEAIIAATKRDTESPGQVVPLDRPAKRTLLVAEASGSVSGNGKDFVNGPADNAGITLAP